MFPNDLKCPVVLKLFQIMESVSELLFYYGEKLFLSWSVKILPLHVVKNLLKEGTCKFYYDCKL